MYRFLILPSIKPEYTLIIYSVSADLYLSHTKDYITHVTNLTDGDILLMTYINCASNLKIGLDLSLKISAAGSLDGVINNPQIRKIIEGKLLYLSN